MLSVELVKSGGRGRYSCIILGVPRLAVGRAGGWRQRALLLDAVADAARHMIKRIRVGGVGGVVGSRVIDA